MNIFVWAIVNRFYLIMTMTGPLLAAVQKLRVQNFTLEVSNLFNIVTIFTPVFRLLLLM